jgi:hypothetical protein
MQPWRKSVRKCPNVTISNLKKISGTLVLKKHTIGSIFNRNKIRKNAV